MEVIDYDQSQNVYYLLNNNNYIMKLVMKSNTMIPYICGKLIINNILPLDEKDIKYITYQTRFYYSTQHLVQYNPHFDILQSLGKMSVDKFFNIKQIINHYLVHDLLNIIIDLCQYKIIDD